VTGRSWAPTWTRCVATSRIAGARRLAGWSACPPVCLPASLARGAPSSSDTFNGLYCAPRITLSQSVLDLLLGWPASLRFCLSQEHRALIDGILRHTKMFEQR
jgi:hypothetical protein